jgi:AraC-like DNA-binding protein
MSSRHVEKGTIAIAFVHEALACIRARGIDEQPLLYQAGISPGLLTSSQTRVSSLHYGQLWHGIAQAIDDEFFGLDSHPVRPGSFTLMCHSVIHADTLERALRRTLRFLKLVIDDLEAELSVVDGIASIVVRDRIAPGGSGSGAPKVAFSYGTYLLILHGLACWLIGRRIPLYYANFRCAEPAFSDEWRVLFSQDLRFGQEVSGFAFAPEFLAMPNIQNERTMKKFLRQAPANFLVRYKNSESATAQIRRRLREMAISTWPDFSSLATQMHSSTATLRRRLEKEGITYRTILDDLRRDMAISLLSDYKLGIPEIAETLGFTETSAFYRAFKKWTGSAPGQYRQIIGSVSYPIIDTKVAAKTSRS